MNIIEYLLKSVTTTAVVVTLFACEGNYSNIQQLNQKDMEPVGVGKEINLKYTDSGQVVTNLISPLLRDYRNYEFPFQEFPEGVTVYFYDKDKKTTVTSDYAISYENTGIIDLRRNVVILTHDSIELRAEQLYWDQKSEWVFTDQPYTITFADGSFNNGGRFDSSQDFTNFLSRNNDGVQLIDNATTDGD